MERTSGKEKLISVLSNVIMEDGIDILNNQIEMEDTLKDRHVPINMVNNMLSIIKCDTFYQIDWDDLEIDGVSRRISEETELNQSFVKSILHTIITSKMNFKDGDSLFEEGETHRALRQYDQAIECYVKSANSGNICSQKMLGNAYRRGYCKRKINYEEAMNWYRMASEQGDGDSSCNIAYLFMEDEDYTSAKEYLEKAVEQGSHDAEATLGRFYLKGLGCQIDNEKSFEFFSKAANVGIQYAMYEMGIFYANGVVVKKDKEIAIKWFLKANEISASIKEIEKLR